MRATTIPRSTSFIHLSNTKPEHMTGGSGRSARRSGRAGSGKIRCQHNYPPRKQNLTVTSKASKERRFTVSPGERTSQFLCIFRIPNPDIPPANRVGALGGAAGRGRARLGANIIIRQVNKSSLFPPSHRRNVASPYLQKNEHANSYVFVESLTRTYHRRIGSGRLAERPSGVGQD